MMRDEERDPLLQSEDDTPTEGKAYKVGPLEITRSTRYGILAGIWAATFLSVCSIFLMYVSPMLSLSCP